MGTDLNLTLGGRCTKRHVCTKTESALLHWEAFQSLQSELPKLVPIQDVQSHWNSTFLMLRRAKQLHSTFNEYCVEYGQPHLKLDAEEWRQIQYLL